MGQPDIEFPAGRYGRRRGPRKPRWLAVLVVAALAVVAGLAITLKLYDTYTVDEVPARVVRFAVVSDSVVRVQFEINNKSGSAATCVVRARSRDGAEVGRAQIVVAADSPATVVYTLTTSKKAVTGEVLGCKRR